MKAFYNPEQNAQTDYQALRYQVMVAINVMEQGRIKDALDDLKHAVGYTQSNKDFEDRG